MELDLCKRETLQEAYCNLSTYSLEQTRNI